MVRRIIAAIGPEAGAAVPKLIQIVNKKKGDAAQDMLALAAIGEPAGKAVPVLVKSADESSPRRGSALYALFCIRGEAEDLEQMVEVLKNDESGRAELARYLNALGVKARAVADKVEQLMKSEDFAKQKEKLEAFLAKVERGEGPTVLMP